MWTPWRTALLAGLSGGCGSILPLGQRDILYLTVFSVVMAVLVASFTWLGLKVSRRPLLPVKAAVILVVVIFLAEFLSTRPIATHAVLRNLPSGSPDERMALIYLLGIAAIIAPAFIAATAGRIAGAPSNTSIGRTRE